MKNSYFKNYIEKIMYAPTEEFELLKHCGYYVLDCTDKQLIKLADALVKYRGYQIEDNVVIFAGLEIDLTRRNEVK